ncbi:arabinosyltransferase domain-containing protein [Actinomycetospora lutea]|uniref:arabinosyltransferase domain-containing protein n=1 Tax=Actinomycetospora lutea TaxID=663604 RepID=UPI0023660D71|nr:arabinosyltransferase domain-containing protein [Actinomycetospora lutea]MDD7940966.1 arabinosyltransferase domain-containing protein [Actinomycetospora lutea]
MTATPRTSPDTAGSRDDEATRPGAGVAPPTWPLPVALAAAAVALVCAVLLPLLPVTVDQPVVSWPEDPSAPASTALHLTTQRPLALDVRADCTAARAAGDGLVLATMPPPSTGTPASALLVTARDDRLAVVSRGVPLFDGPLPPGACSLAVTGDVDGGLTVALDGRVVGRGAPDLLPDVDALVTSVPAAAPGTPAGLAVRLTLDDQFATSPTPVKTAVTVLLVLAVLVGLGALVVRDRHASPAHGGGRRRVPRPRVVDAVVPAVLVLWTFLAPMTDDDGYYSAMAANVPFTGYVANYYQLYNQSFTPFTWIYYVLSVWQTEIGLSPVLLRVPSLVLALVTWVLLRAYVSRALPAGTGRGRAVALHAALAIAFLAWWLPYDMGVRAEAVVATSVVASLLALAVGLERDRWSLLGLSVGVAAFGATAAPTGFVALAPLLACLPAVWRRLRGDGTRRRAFGRLVAVSGPGALVGVLAFADGSLRDFLRAQQIFLGMQSQESWYTEIVRWGYLLDDTAPMGAYAKRAPVLVGLVALAVLGLLATYLRGRGRPLPTRTALAGTTLLLGFALLLLTPSKWTHHFGTLAGVGAAVLALVVVGAPVLLRDLAGGDTTRPVLRPPVVVGAGLVVAVVAGLAGHGANAWPYSWLLGLPDAGEAPTVAFVALGQPAWWLLGGLVVAGALLVLVRRRAPEWRPVLGVLTVAVTASAVLLVSTVYLVGSFALATARTADTWSPWADAVRDPLGRDCVAASQMQVLDPAGARPMSPVPGLPSPVPGGPSGFVPGGWFPASPPPDVAGATTWGSFTPPPAGPAAAIGDDATVGSFATPWYAIPDRPDAAMTTSVSGRTGGGNVLRVEYARPEGDRLVPVGEAELGVDPDGGAVDSPTWRGLLLEAGNGPPPGASVMRLVAEDTSTARGGWLAFTAPTVQRWTSLQDYAVPGEASAVSWQYAFLFPCQRKPVQAAGINEPSTLGVVWGDQELAYDLDGIWQIPRGGMFAQSARDSSMVGLVTRLRDAPDAEAGTVYRLRPYVPDTGAYRLEKDSVTVAGWTPAPNTTMSTPVDEIRIRPDS